MFTRSSLYAIALVLVVACGRKDDAADKLVDPSAARDAIAPMSDAAVIDAAAETDGGRVLSWLDATRLERWPDAARAIDALSDADRAQPEMRFVRARAAMGAGDWDGALKSLDHLEDALPLLADTIERRRAESELHVGPFDRAAEYFADRPSLDAQLKAAQAFLRAGNEDRARVAAEHVLASDKRAPSQEMDARAIHVKVADDARKADDARWLAIHALDADTESLATATLAKVDHAHPLKGGEWLTRARVLADAGRSDDALRALAQAETAPYVPSGVDLCRARADVFYKTKKWSDAHLVYTSCVAKGDPRAAEDAFLAARSLSRADRDTEAALAFTHVAERYPGTTWAEEASFLAGRIHVMWGRWREAVIALDEHVKKFHGTEAREAARYRAIAHLMAKDWDTARRLFEDLAGDTADAVEQASWINLAALAAFKDGDRLHAVARWSEVARSRSLTWPALVARARLREAGAVVPPAIDPPESVPSTTPLSVDLPPPVDLLHRIGLDGDAEEALRARENVIAQRAPARATEALCGAYEELGRAKRRHQIAQGVPHAFLAAAPSARTRWAWTCAFPSPFEDAVDMAEARERLPAGLVYAVMRQESGYDPEVTSPARAVGLLQLLPETAQIVASEVGAPDLAAHLTSPESNVVLGARYLKDLVAKYEVGARSRPVATTLALGAYNGGPESIDRWLSRAPGVELDVFVERIPFAETRGYVVRVMSNLARYGYLAHGEDGVPQLTLGLEP